MRIGDDCGRATRGLFHHDKVPAHNAQSMKQFLTKRNIAVLELKDSTRRPAVLTRERHQDDCDDKAAEDLVRLRPKVCRGVKGKDGKVC